MSNKEFSMLIATTFWATMTFSSCLLHVKIACNHLTFFKIPNFVHFCPNFQTFCPFLLFSNIFLPFFWKIAHMFLLSRLGQGRSFECCFHGNWNQFFSGSFQGQRKKKKYQFKSIFDFCLWYVEMSLNYRNFFSTKLFSEKCSQSSGFKLGLQVKFKLSQSTIVWECKKSQIVIWFTT